MNAMDRSRLPTRVVRLAPGDPWPNEDAIPDGLTPSQRLELVWTLTLQAYALAGEPVLAPMRRDVVRVIRTES
jgi:hypothetical protein